MSRVRFTVTNYRATGRRGIGPSGLHESFPEINQVFPVKTIPLPVFLTRLS